MLETLDHTIRIGSTPSFLYFDLYLYSAYAAHYVYIRVRVCVRTCTTINTTHTTFATTKRNELLKIL